MRFMILVKATPDSEAGRMPDAQMLTAMGRFNEELVAAGVMQAGDGLHPSSRGARIDFKGGGATDITRGPFGQIGELVSGYWIWQCESMDAAIDWARRAPMPAGAQLEVRKAFEAEDFGEAMTPELKAQESRLREELKRAS